MMSFLQGAITRDTTRIVSAMKEMGFISRRADPEVFDRVVQYFHDKLRGQVSVQGFSLKDISSRPTRRLGSLLDLRELNVSLADLRDAFHIPKEWILLERTLLLLLGVCTTLDPEMNPTDGHRAVPRALPAGREEAVVGGRRRGLARDGAGGAVAARRAAALHEPRAARRARARASRNLEDNARLLYYGGQQIALGDADGGGGGAGGAVRRARPAGAPAWAAGIASALFAALPAVHLARGPPAGAGGASPTLTFRIGGISRARAHAPDPGQHPGEAAVRRRADRLAVGRCSCAIVLRRRKDPERALELDAALPAGRRRGPRTT